MSTSAASGSLACLKAAAGRWAAGRHVGATCPLELAALAATATAARRCGPYSYSSYAAAAPRCSCRVAAGGPRITHVPPPVTELLLLLVLLSLCATPSLCPPCSEAVTTRSTHVFPSYTCSTRHPGSCATAASTLSYKPSGLGWGSRKRGKNATLGSVRGASAKLTFSASGTGGLDAYEASEEPSAAVGYAKVVVVGAW